MLETGLRAKPALRRRGECNRGAGLAIIESTGFDRRTVLLISPVPPEKVRVLQVGDLYVSLYGRDLGQVGREGL
jgi:hypothetical protein